MLPSPPRRLDDQAFRVSFLVEILRTATNPATGKISLVNLLGLTHSDQRNVSVLLTWHKFLK